MDIKKWKVMLAVDHHGSFTRAGLERLHPVRHHPNDEVTGKGRRLFPYLKRLVMAPS